jgi:hypothetical protein
MSLSAREKQALDSIEGGLAGSAPELTSMLATFSRLAASEDMPERAKVRALQPRRARRRRQHPGRDGVLRHARRLYLRLGWQQTMLLLWLVVSIGLVVVALMLSRGGHAVCTQSWGTCGW